MFLHIFVIHRKFLAYRMKIVKIIASFLLFLGILVLMVWSGIRANDQKCTGISVVINTSGEPKLLAKSDVLGILERNNIEWEGKKIKEIELSSIHKILAQENYIKSVDKVHFSGSKLQIEVSLYDILLEINSNTGQKFLLDVEGTYLPHSPKVRNDVIIVNGFINNTFQKNKTVTPENNELYEVFTVASLIKKDPFYAALFQEMYVNDKQEIILHPSVGKLPVLFGTMQDAENKLKTLKYMYEEVIPYTGDEKYAQLDVRFKNRIVATKTKS